MPPLPLPEPPLVDERVLLRPWQPDDAERGLLAGFSDPLVQRFSWPEVEPFGADDAHAFVAAWAHRREAGTELNLALVPPADPALVLGGASLHEVDLRRATAGIGYWLAPHARGRGVASRAVRLLAAWGFERLGLDRLQLTCAPDNLASQRVAERCGFTREGVLRAHIRFKGERRDTMVFSLLRGEPM